MKLAYSILILIFSVIITSEIAGIYFLYEFKNNLEDQVIRDAEKSNIVTVKRIDNYVTDRLVDLINIVKSSTYETPIQTSNMQFSQMADPEQYIDKMDAVWTSAPINETTPFMKTLIDSQPSEQLRQTLNSENILFNGKVYGEIFMTNAYGVNVIESDKTSDYRQNDEVWWQEARKNGIYIGGTEFDKSSGIASYTVAARINDENGNFIGVAKAVVSIQQIINIIKSEMNGTSDTEPIEYELINHNGTVIYSTDHTENSGSSNKEPGYANNMKDFSGHFTYLENDQKYIIVYSHSSSSKISSLFDWIFVTKYRSSDILQPVIQLTNDLVLTMIIVIVIISVTIFVVSKKLVRPIEKIQEGLTSFSKGNRVEIKPQGMTELRNLIEHFNRMTETISNSQDIISKSEEQFRRMFELSPEAIILSDANYIIKSVNQKFLEICGYNMNEIIGKPATIIIPERTQKQYEEYKASTKDKLLSEKAWLIKKDKTEFPCMISAQKIYDFNKKFLGNLIVIKDITDIEEAAEKIKKAEIELRKSENRYRGLFELTPDPIRILSLDRTITEVNESYLRKFGYSKDELIGKSIYVNIDENSRANMENVFDRLRSEKNVENIEIMYHKKDGTKVPGLLSIGQFHDQTGNPIGYITITKDISEIYDVRKKNQEEEQKRSDQYAITKQEEVQKDQFASMISHELTTPLFPIKFQSEMLKDPELYGKLNKEQTNSVNDIYQNAIQLEKIISDILYAQKLEMGGMKFTKTNFELKQFMNNITNSAKNLIENKIIEFENSTQDQITLNSDPDRLAQVFANLIKNSVDFTPENVGKIEIGAKMQENDVLFHVKDNGIGIPKDKQVNLFKKFYQVDTSIKRKHRGSGLGLSICKGIVEGLGGKIWLESTENVGTIVYFTIPKGDIT